jgi:hypothetical protein
MNASLFLKDGGHLDIERATTAAPFALNQASVDIRAALNMADFADHRRTVRACVVRLALSALVLGAAAVMSAFL